MERRGFRQRRGRGAAPRHVPVRRVSSSEPVVLGNYGARLPSFVTAAAARVQHERVMFRPGSFESPSLRLVMKRSVSLRDSGPLPSRLGLVRLGEKKKERE